MRTLILKNASAWAKHLYMHTKYEDGKLSSSVYIKDKDGKKCATPVINGTKFTAAALRDHLKTELTFGVEAFISEDPRIQFDFMTKVYKERLKEKGIVFDKRSEALSRLIALSIRSG